MKNMVERGNYASQPQRFNGSSSAKEYEVASNEIGISRKVGVFQIPSALFSCLFGAFTTGFFRILSVYLSGLTTGSVRETECEK
jgi:hypothetical protein